MNLTEDEFVVYMKGMRKRAAELEEEARGKPLMHYTDVPGVAVSD